MDPAVFALELKGEVNTVLSAHDVREQPGTAYMTISAPYTQRTLSKTFSAKKFFGKNHANIVGESELRGSVSADPSEKAYYRVTVSDIGALTLGHSDGIPLIHWEAEIFYSATFTERKAIVAS